MYKVHVSDYTYVRTYMYMYMFDYSHSPNNVQYIHIVHNNFPDAFGLSHCSITHTHVHVHVCSLLRNLDIKNSFTTSAVKKPRVLLVRIFQAI